MIRKPDECKVDYKENMRGGDGTVEITNFVTADELLGKGRLFAKIKLVPGAGIGYHMHEGESEIFNIIAGTAEYSDNGDIKTVTAGDVLVCPPGEGHSIKNIGDTDVLLTALIIFA